MLAEVERAKAGDLPRVRVFDDSNRYNYELRDVLEMFYRLEVEEMATRAALERTESRGTHYREDCPARRDDAWLRNIVFWRGAPDGRTEVPDKARGAVVHPSRGLAEYAAQTSPWH